MRYEVSPVTCAGHSMPSAADAHATASTRVATSEEAMDVKAVFYDAPRSYAVTDVPTPEPDPGQVRIKVDQVGVCGTDLHIHEGDFNAVFPLIPGHEVVGVIDRVGAGVDRVRLGEQVSVNPNVHCGRCEYCLSGRLILCADLKGYGSNFPGFFAEYVT